MYPTIIHQTMRYTHKTERVKSDAFVLFVRMYSLLPCVCVLPPPQPSSTSDHICPSACHGNRTFQKRPLCNLSQFCKSINFLCVACLFLSPIFKNRGCSTIMITATGGIRESTHSSLCPSSAQT